MNIRRNIDARVMAMRRHGRRGSLAVEAAIFVPLFIVGVLTLGWLIQMTATGENVYHSLADETLRYASDVPRSYMASAYKSDAVKRISDDNEKKITSIKVSPALVHIPMVSASAGKTYTDMIGASVSYKAKIGIPNIFSAGLTGRETAICRAFVGTKNAGEVHSFDAMEKDKDSHLVWVFPRAGERYHGKSCSYIKNAPMEVLFTSAVRGSYSPCKLCKPSAMPYGSLAYVFQTGGVYHSGDCYIVERYVISMSEDEAKKQGYSQCSKCGGK